MKRFVVSIDVFCESCDLQDLQAITGEEGDFDSYDRGAPDAIGRSRLGSMLRVASDLPELAPIDDHIGVLLPVLERIAVRLCESSVTGIKLMLNVGVFFDTAMVSFVMPAIRLPDTLVPFSLAIAAYPVGEECVVPLEGEKPMSSANNE